ncbi:MAG: FKBP-type peptidyl-prolyl cis-trans isomerase [Lewinellaceae bacterium]|nr:FKBP-type peptidyl-prolyl cis-trans isomerase [Lewinellaceae bacterium]
MPDKKKKGIQMDSPDELSHEWSQPSGRSWFLGIGINEYKEFPGLNNAVKDVQDIEALLLDKYDLDPENVILLLDQNASEENIIDQLDYLTEHVREEDKLLIYYSGHGHLNKSTGLAYWIPFDAKKDKTARYIRNSTIRDFIKVIKARHILLVSDSCFSGSLFARGTSRSTYAMEELEKIPSRWAICSGRHDEEVYDGEPGKNSPFAESILDVLSRNQSNALNVAKIADRVVDQTRANYEQLPEGNPLYGVGHKGGQYIFKLKANEPADWKACKAEGSLSAFRLFLEKYPEGQYAAEARENLSFLEEEEAWAKARREHSLFGYYEYDRLYPNGRYSRQSLEAIRELEEEKAWQTALEKKSLYHYRKYVLDYPQGKYVKEAKSRIESLMDLERQRKEPIPPAKEKETKVPEPPKVEKQPEPAPEKKERPLPRQHPFSAAAEKKEPAKIKLEGKARWLLLLLLVPLAIWGVYKIVGSSSGEGGKADTPQKITLEGVGVLTQYIKTGNPPPKPGDYVYFHAYVRNGDSLVYGSPQSLKFPAKQDGSSASPVLKALAMMGAGDSATLILNIDTLPQKPQGFENAKEMFYDIAVTDVVTEDAYQAGKEKERAAGLGPVVQGLVEEYKPGVPAGPLRKTNSGLEYLILEKGTGLQPQPGQEVKVHYKGVLLDGKTFDSSFARGKPISFILGKGQVIKGWDEGIALLRQGDKAILAIPPGLGYGQRGAPPTIPPDADLIFYVWLVEVGR